jgi:hypothetical protein
LSASSPENAKAPPSRERYDARIGREALGLLDAERAEIGEDHLGGAGLLERLAVRTDIGKVRRLLPDAKGIV